MNPGVRGPSNARDEWDAEAAVFDAEPDHGLGELAVRDAWRDLLLPVLAPAGTTGPLDVADLGCGTGSLSVLLAEAGHRVHGVDFAPRMLDLARAKADRARMTITFTEADVADPPLPAAGFDVVLSRHVLWAMPDPAATLGAWLALLRPTGRLLLVEGRWSTGAGLTAEQCAAAVLRHRREADVHLLVDRALWGGPVTDERYLLVSRH